MMNVSVNTINIMTLAVLIYTLIPLVHSSDNFPNKLSSNSDLETFTIGIPEEVSSTDVSSTEPALEGSNRGNVDRSPVVDKYNTYIPLSLGLEDNSTIPEEKSDLNQFDIRLLPTTMEEPNVRLSDNETFVLDDDTTPEKFDFSLEDNIKSDLDDDIIPEDSYSNLKDDSESNLDNDTAPEESDINRDDSSKSGIGNHKTPEQFDLNLEDDTRSSLEDKTTAEESELSLNEDFKSGLDEDMAPEEFDLSVTNDSESGLDEDTIPEKFDISHEDTDNTTPEDNSTSDKATICPNIGPGTGKEGVVVKCYCKANEIFDGKDCIPYDEEVVVPVQHHKIFSKLVNINKYKVVIQNVECDPNIYFMRNFREGEFHLRTRGDVVLLEDTGRMIEQRISNYCITHRLTAKNDLTWTLRACIPIPFVPRCCPGGSAMKDGECQPAKTPESFKPPIVVKPHSKVAVDLEIIHSRTNHLTCESDPMVTLPLWNNGSHLLLLSSGLTFIWKPNEVSLYERTRRCPEYCVDGKQHSNGAEEYFVSFCYTNPEEVHAKTCQEGPCIRKCCEDGSSFSTKGCSKDPNYTFSLLDVTGSSSYEPLFGRPFCYFPKIVEEDVAIDNEGQLVLSDRNYYPGEYCVEDYFNDTHRELRALACRDEPLTWKYVQSHLMYILFGISTIFLTLSIVCHILVPKLLAHGGVHQLCHIIALFMANLSSFIINSFSDYLRSRYTLCVIIALVMQYGFLATFLWLNVMCYEIWRKIRKLVKLQVAKTYSEIFFMLYGWGIPLIIVVITTLMQFVGRHRIRDEIRPYLGANKCWFEEPAGLWLYFYGPIALLCLCNAALLIHTFINNKIILKESKEASKDLKTIGRSTKQMTDHVRDFHQKLKLFALAVFCWATEVLSAVIPPPGLWALTDCCNALQGVFIFMILMTNSNKRKLMEKKFPSPFRFARRIQNILCKSKGLSGNSNQNSHTAVYPSSSDSSSVNTTISTLELSSVVPHESPRS